MPQFYPVIVQAGRTLSGDSLGFHAYSLRVDNCTNQWYLEETSLAYIPPYSLGVCLRLYGTGVAILLNSAPVGQPQLAPITGEQVVGVYSDQLRTEVAPSPIRQFTLVQSVSDLLQGAQPTNPPVGTTRMWAASNGDLHYLISSGVDATLLSSTNYASYVAGSPLGGDLAGIVSNGTVYLRNTSYIYGPDTHGVNPRMLGRASSDATYLFTGTNGLLYFYSDYPPGVLGLWQASPNNLGLNGTFSAAGIGVNKAAVGDSLGGLIQMQNRIGPQIDLFDNGGNVGYGIGVNNNELTLFTSGFVGIRANNNSGARNLYFDVTTGNSYVNVSYANNVQCAGVVYLPDTSYGIQWGGTTNCSIYGSNANSLMQFNAPGNPAIWRWYAPTQGIYCDLRMSQLTNTSWAFLFWNSAWINTGQGFVVGGNNLNGQSFFCAGGAGGPTGWQIISTRKYKRDITPIDDALKIVLSDVNAYHFVSEPPEHYKLRETPDDPLEPASYAQYGFIGEEWETVAPDVLDFDDDKQVRMMDYGQVNAILFQAFKQYVARTEARLAALEAA